jgi:hypothetical protein
MCGLGCGFEFRSFWIISISWLGVVADVNNLIFLALTASRLNSSPSIGCSVTWELTNVYYVVVSKNSPSCSVVWFVSVSVKIESPLLWSLTGSENNEPAGDVGACQNSESCTIFWVKFFVFFELAAQIVREVCKEGVKLEGSHTLTWIQFKFRWCGKMARWQGLVKSYTRVGKGAPEQF